VSGTALQTPLLALGDSYSCGEGVGTRVHPAHTWVGVLGHALGAGTEVLARPGARIGHVRRDQVPLAVARHPQLVTLLAGLNDVCRTGWSDEAVTADLLASVESLREAGAVVVLGRLHDAALLLPLPRRLRAESDRRIAVVNAAVDAARAPGVVIVDLASVPELRSRDGWAVDRVHPGVAGHRGIAEAAAAALATIGIDAVTPRGTPWFAPPTGRLAELLWLSRHGAPYLLRNAVKSGAFRETPTTASRST